MVKQPFVHIDKSLSIIRQLIQLSWEAQPVVLISLVAIQVMQGVFPTITAWLIKQIFDLISQISSGNIPNNSVHRLLLLLLSQISLTTVLQIFNPLSEYFNSELARALRLKTETMIFRQVARLDGLAYFENPKLYDTIRLASHSMQSGPYQVLYSLINIIRNCAVLISFAGVLLVVNPVLATIMIIGSLPQLIVQIKVGGQKIGLQVRNSPKERRISYFEYLLSNIDFVKEIRLFNLSEYFLARLLKTLQEVQKLQQNQQMHEIRWQLGLIMISSLVGGGSFAIVLLQALSREVSLGDVTLYSAALLSIQAAISAIISSISNMNQSALFFTHYLSLVSLPPSLPVIEPIKDPTQLEHGIEFRNVSFRYSENHPLVLRNINLFLPKGQCLALVGLNGAGKTTLVKLLTRMYDPTEGSIVWDGVNIQHFEVGKYRNQISTIFQDFVRYDLTAQENIGVGDVNEIHNLERIRQVARHVDIDNWLQVLPKGYQTVLSRWLGEDATGIDLSGGQWQKVAMARLLMRNANLLILDEPTAALDAIAEYELYQHFLELIQGCTSLVISHRFSTTRMAQAIAVLNDGYVMEYGTHDELIMINGLYTKLYMMQAQHYDLGIVKTAKSGGSHQ